MRIDVHMDVYQYADRCISMCRPLRIDVHMDVYQYADRCISTCRPLRIDVHMDVYQYADRCVSTCRPLRIDVQTAAYRRADRCVSTCRPLRIDVQTAAYRCAHGRVSIRSILAGVLWASGGAVEQLLVERHDGRHKATLADEVPGDDVEGAHLGAGALLPDPGQQRGVRGRHQVLQGLGGVRADVLQVLRQVDARHKETA